MASHPVVLEPKVFDVLLYLLEHRDRIMTKDELLEHCWTGTCVRDAALTRCLAKGRKAVQPEPPGAPVIEFGIDLTQDAPGFGAARLVHTALILPHLAEQRNLPAQAPQDESLPQRQALRGHMGHAHGPGGQREPWAGSPTAAGVP